MPRGRGARIIALSRVGPDPQHTQQLRPVEPDAAYRRIIEQQHRNLHAITPLQLPIGVNIQQPQRRQYVPRTQCLQLIEHVLA